MKRTICLILVAILCIGLLAGCGSGTNSGTGSGKSGNNDGGTTLKSFNVTYSCVYVEQFLNNVCQNIDAEYARVDKVIETSYSISDIIEATLEIKVAGKAPQKVVLRIYNSGWHCRDVVDSETVEMIELEGFAFSEYGDAEYICNRAVILGLEKTLGGGNAANYLKPYDEVNMDSIEREWDYRVSDYNGQEYWKLDCDYWVCDTAKAFFGGSLYEDSDKIHFSYRLEKAD